MKSKDYEVIVVGAGHAGCEAAYACAKKGHKTALITLNINNIADMPCNPSIGGTAKGIIVREIDALGGIMGKAADQAHFQIKMLNISKGPAVRSLRAQMDKIVYPQKILNMLNELPTLDLIEGEVIDLIIKDKIVCGIKLSDNQQIKAKIVILTTGTYLKSSILVGDQKTPGGPHGEKTASALSNNLNRYGHSIIRLKTGTPPRIKKDSIDFSSLIIEEGDQKHYTFSHDSKPYYDISNQQKCYLLYTTEKTHQIIKDNLDKSSMYGGFVEGVGPRYCPSIEDKIVRFSTKERHQLFLEPESLFYDEWYLQGFSTSMPTDVQELMVHSLPGLEKAKITKYAYAIEYDAIDPLQIKPSLESKVLANLYTAGQINGTSGYEEAAAQGLVAGINAALSLEAREPIIIKRNQGYIGVLIDDLVTKGTKEPYRMLTSRAEFRLILRHDNADLRLREIGYQVGLISEEQYQVLINKKNHIDSLINHLKTTNLSTTSETKKLFKINKIEYPSRGTTLYQLLKRPDISINFINQFSNLDESENILEVVEVLIKYEGYIKKADKEIEKLLKLEAKQIPADIDYNKIKSIATEACQKLNKIRPETIAQASRISGINPADIAVLAIYLRKEYGKDE